MVATRCPKCATPGVFAAEDLDEVGRFVRCARCGTAWLARKFPGDLSALAAESSLAGLEFIYAMPGSVGGSVWMNARCYSVSVSQVLDEVEYVDPEGKLALRRTAAKDDGFAYKVSPFQSMRCLITRATFRLSPGIRAESVRAMEEHRADRERKGHFRFPCAGSAFKNDPAFGEPTGMIVDALGLRGFAVGGAAVADYHGNIVINRGGASAADVLAVLRHVERAAFEAHGFRLERELLLVGDWERNEDKVEDKGEDRG